MSLTNASRDERDTQRKRQIKVAVIGAGISGLSFANGLLKDKSGRFDVHVFERDTEAFDSDRGGYQLRISSNGLEALRTISDRELWKSLQNACAGDELKAPAIVDPNFNPQMILWKQKLYPPSRSVPRSALRAALLQPLLDQGRVHLNHKFSHFEYAPKDDTGVNVHFTDQPSQYADILIAADGSNSLVNKQVGLKNKVKLESLTVVQAVSTVDSNVKEKLPKVLVDNGSIMVLLGNRGGTFASVYEKRTEPASTGPKSYVLYWSMALPSKTTGQILPKDDIKPETVIPPLINWFRKEFKSNEAFPTVLSSATGNLRTSQITSSVKPATNWRDSDTRNGRVFLLGDAVHPMTPGRGMGANQALCDAGELARLFCAASFDQDVPSDEELAALAQVFDKEMYDRAFKMVKASEKLMSLDLSRTSGRLMLKLVGAGMTVLGWLVSLLELLGLRKREVVDIDTYVET